MAILDNHLHMSRFPHQGLLLHGRYAISARAGRESVYPLYRGVDVRHGNRPVDIGVMGLANGGLQREAARLGSLRHAHLPHIYDVFHHQGAVYLVMDALEGKSLLQLLREQEGHPLPVPLVLEYARQLCDVLVYLSRCEPPLLVRDLQPANVVVSGNGQLSLVYPGIFGFPQPGSLPEEEDITLRSPARALREQRSAPQANSRPALSGLGLLLRACLTGRMPSPVVENTGVPFLYRYNYQVPVELDRLIQRLVTVDERQPQISLCEVQQVLLRIDLQADERTVAVAGPRDPARDGQCALTPPGSGTEEECETLPVNARLPRSASGQPACRTSVGQAPPGNATGRVWTARFVALSALALVLLLASSLFALVFISGSAHIVEFALSIALLIAAIASASSLSAHRLLPWAILLSVAVLSLLSGLASLVQATPAVQRAIADALPVAWLDWVISCGLAGAALVSLAWLARPFPWRNRVSLALVFIGAGLCALSQYVLREEMLPRQALQRETLPTHLLLVVALVLLVWGVVVAAYMERVRVREKSEAEIHPL